MNKVWNRQFLGAGMPAFANGDASASFNGPWLPCQGAELTLDLAWTGTTQGTFALQCSYDGGTTARTVPGSAAEFTANSQAQPAGGASQLTLNWINVPGPLWRVTFTRTAGTGTVTGYYSQR